jgi:hypothetical protein
MMKWLREIRHEFEPLGVKVSHTNGGHLRLDLPNGKPIFTGSTPSDWRVMRKVRSQVRRALEPQSREALPEIVADAVPAEPPASEPNVILEQPGELEPPLKPVGQVVYHHTDTSHLALILRCGELRRGRDEVLWATTDPKGDRMSITGCGRGREALRAGHIKCIRFTLNAELFEDGWRDAAAKHQVWGGVDLREDVAKLFKQSTKCWRWRWGPVPVDQCLIEMKGYRDNQWIPVEKFSLISLPTDDTAIIRLGDWLYSATPTANGINYRRPRHHSELLRLVGPYYQSKLKPGDMATNALCRPLEAVS